MKGGVTQPGRIAAGQGERGRTPSAGYRGADPDRSVPLGVPAPQAARCRAANWWQNGGRAGVRGRSVTGVSAPV